jgi:hypothetical protein
MEILAPHAHWIRFAYDDQARIVKAQDDAGAWAAYTYSLDGMLLSVVHSSGRERHYTYDGPRMTTISDERGQLLLRNTYSDRLLVGQQYADGSVFSFRYQLHPGRAYFSAATVTLPDGSERTVDTLSSVPAYLRKQD